MSTTLARFQHRRARTKIFLVPIQLISEFAAVQVDRDDNGNGPRLIICDLRSGRRIFLDPLELAALAWTRHEELLPLLDPARLDRETRRL